MSKRLKQWWRASSESDRCLLLRECHLDPGLAPKPYDELTAAQKGALNGKYLEKHEDDEP
jgi:hypothetical protein